MVDLLVVVIYKFFDRSGLEPAGEVEWVRWDISFIAALPVYVFAWVFHQRDTDGGLWLFFSASSSRASRLSSHKTRIFWWEGSFIKFLITLVFLFWGASLCGFLSVLCDSYTCAQNIFAVHNELISVKLFSFRTKPMRNRFIADHFFFGGGNLLYRTHALEWNLCYQHQLEVQPSFMKSWAHSVTSPLAHTFSSSPFCFLKKKGTWTKITFFGILALQVSSNLLSDYHTSLFISICRAAISILVLFSYPLQLHPCRNSLEKVWQAYKPSDHNPRDEDSLMEFVGLTTSLLLSSFLIAVNVERLETV